MVFVDAHPCTFAEAESEEEERAKKRARLRKRVSFGHLDMRVYDREDHSMTSNVDFGQSSRHLKTNHTIAQIGNIPPCIHTQCLTCTHGFGSMTAEQFAQLDNGSQGSQSKGVSLHRVTRK